VLQKIEQTRRNQPVFNGAETAGCFWMVFPGIVLQALAVADVGGFQGGFRNL